MSGLRTIDRMPSFESFNREPDVRSFRSGDTIFRAGDPRDCMFAIIDVEPRSGTAMAGTDCKLAAIGEKRFLRLIEQTPRFALQIVRAVTERLRRHVPR